MNRTEILKQLRPRFHSDGVWSLFLAYIEDHKIRGDVDEVWLQWDIHLLKQQAGHRPWYRHDNRYLPEAVRLPEAPIL